MAVTGVVFSSSTVCFFSLPMFLSGLRDALVVFQI
jgi:hypothetical protein